MTSLYKLISKKWFHCFVGSTAVWIAVFLFMLDKVLLTFRPLQYVGDLRFIPLDQQPMFSKIGVYMDSAQKVDLLFLGSSLPMYAIAEYDQKLFGEPNCRAAAELRRYLGARYIEQTLSKKLQRQIRAVNMSIVSCMSSDTYVILSHSLDMGKQPKAVVLCVAPRDFVDNYSRPVGRTPSFEVLRSWRSLDELFRPGISQTDARDLVLSNFWHYYRVKVDYRTVLTQFVSILLGHPSNLFYAGAQGATLKAIEVSVAEPKDLAGFNHLYEPRYKPANFTRFPLELDYFQKILSLCKNKQIQCFVVNMPISLPHSKLLDSRLRDLYRRETEKACASAGAKFIDLDNEAFQQSDFSDGLHLNVVGAQKFQEMLVAKLVEDGLRGCTDVQ